MKSEQEAALTIQDDGPGFSDDAIKGFGERRISRALEKSKGNRVSVGLGSVIMKTVAELHRGHVVAKNRINSSGQVLGAEIAISLPRIQIKSAVS
jgi:K+-sensing histidine kinase KdpD